MTSSIPRRVMLFCLPVRRSPRTWPMPSRRPRLRASRFVRCSPASRRRASAVNAMAATWPRAAWCRRARPSASSPLRPLVSRVRSLPSVRSTPVVWLPTQLPMPRLSRSTRRLVSSSRRCAPCRSTRTVVSARWWSAVWVSSASSTRTPRLCCRRSTCLTVLRSTSRMATSFRRVTRLPSGTPSTPSSSPSMPVC